MEPDAQPRRHRPLHRPEVLLEGRQRLRCLVRHGPLLGRVERPEGRRLAGFERREPARHLARPRRPLARDRRAAVVRAQELTSRDADQERAHSQKRGEPHVGPVLRACRVLLGRAQVLQTRAHVRTPVRELLEGGQQIDQRRSLRRRIERSELRLAEPLFPGRDLLHEALEVLLAQIVEGELPALLVRVELLREGLKALDLGLQLGERPRAEHAVDFSHAIEEPDLPLPAPAAPPGAVEPLIDELVHVDLPPGGLLAQDPLEEEIGGPERHVGARVGHEHGLVDVVEGAVPAHRIDDAERMPDPVAVPPLGIAAVRRPFARRGVEPADVPARHAAVEGSHRIGEGARVALAHHAHDVDARPQIPEQRPELEHGEVLVPQGDVPVVRIVRVPGPMVRDEDHERVARPERVAHPGEPAPQLAQARRPKRHAFPDRVRKLGGAERPPRARPLDEPELGRLATAGGQILSRIRPVGGEDRDAVGRNAPGKERGDHVLEVMEVAEVVAGGGPAPVDQDRMGLPRPRFHRGSWRTGRGQSPGQERR